MESWVSLVGDDEAAEEGVSEADADSAIAETPRCATTNRRRGGRLKQQYSDCDWTEPV